MLKMPAFCSALFALAWPSRVIQPLRNLPIESACLRLFALLSSVPCRHHN